ncbi:hypothetical protein J7E71_26810 [Mesobacillus foraminis]|uniref:hypothetical protein n=1 Tax=Mesobacillus foraminis TaxID=279826 RepID=UPI001BE70CEA|nr:hypothetical protein [Mesobacillus foraminis]MBT2759484.1 hypothetical protein [Mesobacillus foraminis]
MNITTIIELDNHEVEKMIGAEFVFSQQQIDKNIVETCVEGFKSKVSEEYFEAEKGMQEVFDKLKENGVIPSKIEDFSFEMPSCGNMLRKDYKAEEMPQKVILSYML